MRYRLTFLLGAGVGYVLGARAGRERYDQLMRSFRDAKEQPGVQSAAGVVAAQATGLAQKARSAVSTRAERAAMCVFSLKLISVKRRPRKNVERGQFTPGPRHEHHSLAKLL